MGGPCLPILISYCKDFKFWASHLEMPEKMVMNRNGGYLLASPLTFLGMLFTISLMSVLVVTALWDMTGTVSGWSIRCHLWITGQQRALGPRHTVTLSPCHTGTRSHQCEIRILILHGSVPPTQAAIPSDIWLWWDHYEYWWKFYILWFPSWCWWLVRPNKLMMNNRWLILACCELNIIRNVGIFLLRSALFLNH